MTEKQFQAKVEELCQALRLRYYHTWNSKHSVGGFPDLVIVGKRTIFVELKATGKDPTRKQEEWLHHLAATGQEVYVWRPEDFATIVRILAGVAGKRLAAPIW